MLTATGVSVRFGGIDALINVSFSLEEFDVMAVVGANGAGKSTLLNVISGLGGGQFAGRVEFDGKRIDGLPAHKRAILSLGRSFQEPRLVDNATVLENVMVGLHASIGYRSIDQILPTWRVVKAERAARLKALATLGFVGLRDAADVDALHLPYGARKKVDIARALVRNPKLLMLDEPTSGLDATERTELLKILHEIAGMRSMTVLLVEHHFDVVRAAANSVLALHAGRVLRAGRTDEVLDDAGFRSVLTGRQTQSRADVSTSNPRRAADG